MSQVKVYSTPACPYCKKTKQFLTDNNIAYQTIDVASDKAGRDEMVNRTGQIGVPVVDIDGELSVGFDEDWLRQKLNI